MFDFFKRSELVRRGLASGKQRRRRARNGLLRGLEYSVGMKGVLLLGFIAGLALLIFSGNQREVTKNFIIALLFFLSALMMLWINQPRTFSQSSRILLVFGAIWCSLPLPNLSSFFAAAVCCACNRRWRNCSRLMPSHPFC